MAIDLPYCGRFAPTPSGPLHFGSLVAAVASYLDAQAHHGKWLVRIEDVDKPRAVTGADSIILRQLEAFGLHWDGEVMYQSQRDEAYRAALSQLQSKHLCYYCTCTRKQIKARGPYYTGYCRDKQRSAENAAIRILNDRPIANFYDRWQGEVNIEPNFAAEDFVLFRRDQLYTYQLAVVVDDIAQGVTDLVRGVDLLTPTAWQLTLWQQFEARQPRLMHVPLALDVNGRKLSKQNHAPALDTTHPKEQLSRAVAFLGLGEVDTGNDISQLLAEASQAWAAKYLS